MNAPKKLAASALLVCAALGFYGPANSAEQKLLLAPYQGNNTALSGIQKTAISELAASTRLQSVNCIALISKSSSKIFRRIAVKRSQAACSWVKKASPTTTVMHSIQISTSKPSWGRIEIRYVVQESEKSDQPTLTGPVVRPSSPFYAYRLSSTGVLERRGSLEQAWYSDSANTPGLSAIRVAAFNAVQSTSKSPGVASVNWIVGTGVPDDMAKAYKHQMNHALNFFDYSKMSTPIDAVLVTELDKDLLREYWQPFFGAEETIARETRALDRYGAQQQFTSVAGGAGGRGLRATNKTIMGITFFMGSKHTAETHLLLEHVAHELAHTWQFYAFGQTSVPANRSQPIPSQFAPCHLMEGGANFLGTAIASPYADWYSEGADVIVNRVMRDLGSLPTSEADVKRLLEQSENWAQCQAGYGIGHLAYEWLVGKFGMEKYLALHPALVQHLSFDSALKSVYGFGKDEFYTNAAPYIFSEINRASR